MFVLASRAELHLPTCQSLKEKRAIVRPIVERLRQKLSLAVAEVDHQDKWQRVAIGIATVGESPRQVEAVLDEADRFLWSRPDVEVLSIDRTWLESD